MASSSSNSPSNAEHSTLPTSSNEIANPHTIETTSMGVESGSIQEAEGVQAEELNVEETDARGAESADATEVIAKGIASVLGPVVRTFETRVEEVLKSQSTLETSIDRLTRELDKLLDDTPLPLGTQHAAKLSGIRKRVRLLADTLRIIQGRVDSMEHMLSNQSVGSLH